MQRVKDEKKNAFLKIYREIIILMSCHLATGNLAQQWPGADEEKQQSWCKSDPC